MSATEHDRPTYTCAYCGGPRSLGETVEGSYCSTACYHREKGQNLIAKVESQSQFCDCCYEPIRDIEPIPERVHPDADGYQYPTPNTTIGVDDFARDRFDRLERTRWSCGACGAVDPDGGPVAELQQIDRVRIAANLWRALAWLANREAIPRKPDRETYRETLAESPHDAALAVGKAVYQDV